jgi:hypothetical protein
MKILVYLVMFLILATVTFSSPVFLSANESGTIGTNGANIKGNFSYINYLNSTNISAFVINFGSFDYERSHIYPGDSGNGNYTVTNFNVPFSIVDTGESKLPGAWHVTRLLTITNNMNATIELHAAKEYPQNCPFDSTSPTTLNGKQYVTATGGNINMNMTLQPFQVIKLNLTCKVNRDMSIIIIFPETDYVLNTTSELFTQPRTYGVTRTLFSSEKHLNFNSSTESWDVFYEFSNNDKIDMSIYSIDIWAMPMDLVFSDKSNNVFEKVYDFSFLTLGPNKTFHSFDNFKYNSTPVIWSNVHFGPKFSKQYSGSYVYQVAAATICVAEGCQGGSSPYSVVINSGGGFGNLSFDEMYKIKLTAPKISVFPGEIKRFNITLKNIGKLTITNITLFSNFGGIWFKPQNIKKLAPGETADIELLLRTPLSLEDILASIVIESNQYSNIYNLPIMIKSGKPPNDLEPGLVPKINIIKRVEQLGNQKYNVSIIILNHDVMPISNMVIKDDIKETKLVRYDPGVFKLDKSSLILDIGEIAPRSIVYYGYRLSGLNPEKLEKIKVLSDHIAIISTEYIYNPEMGLSGDDFGFGQTEQYLAAAAAIVVLTLGLMFYFETRYKK